jgi:hypothetical protein
MKGVCGSKNQTKLKQLFPSVQSRLFKNQGTLFILHFSFFIITADYSFKYTFFTQMVKP